MAVLPVECNPGPSILLVTRSEGKDNREEPGPSS
jgi:hypothetical protein